MMYSGEYRIACDIFDEYLSETIDKKDENDEWYLKYTCLATLLDNGYKGSQNRNRFKAQQLANEGKFNKALESDMLLEFAWFNTGIDENLSGNMLEATIAFTMSALLLNNDIESWVNAILCSLSTKINDIIFHLVRMAYHYNGEDFINQIQKQVNNADKDFVNALLDAIDKVIQVEKNAYKTIRLFDSDTSYRTIKLKQ